MPNPDELIAILDRILNGSRDESEIAQLRQWLKVSGSTLQCVSQDGKFNTNIGQVQGSEIHIGDKIYQVDVEALRELLQPTTPLPDIDWHAVSQGMLEEQLRLTTNLLTSSEGISYRTEQVYVPLGLVERKRQTRRGEDVPPEQGSLLYEETEITQRFEHEQFLEQVLQQGQSPKSGGKRLAIIGEPGAGKTTLLQQIAQWVSEQGEGAIAIWVSLADLRGQELEPYLLERWLQAVVRKLGQAEASPQVKDAFVAQFQQGRVWLLLDGVDEMQVSSGNSLAEISRQVRMGGLLSQARIVLSCRLNLWDGDSNALDTFDTYRTLEFSYPQQVERFIGQWFGALSEEQGVQAERLCAALKAPGKERIRDLVKNPLRLTLLCFNWYLGEGTLPETKAGLYEQFVADFYEWKREQLKTTAQQRRQLNAALGELAREVIDKEETRFRLRHDFVCEFLGEPDEEGSLFWLALQLGWLNKVGVDAENRRKAVYAFFHPTFQEYFAASAIRDCHFFLNHTSENISHPENSYRVFEPRFKEILLLWMGQAKDVLEDEKNKLIQNLMNFEDACGKYYTVQALCLAASSIAEFKNCQSSDSVISEVGGLCFGFFDDHNKSWRKFPDPVPYLAEIALLESDRERVIDIIANFAVPASTNHLYSNKDVALKSSKILGLLGQDSSQAIKALIQLIQCDDLVDRTTSLQPVSSFFFVRIEASKSLANIAAGNEQAIHDLKNVLSPDQNEEIQMNIIQTIGQLAPDDNFVIDFFTKRMQSSNDDNVRLQAARRVLSFNSENAVTRKTLSDLSNSTDRYISTHATQLLEQGAVITHSREEHEHTQNEINDAEKIWMNSNCIFDLLCENVPNLVRSWAISEILEQAKLDYSGIVHELTDQLHVCKDTLALQIIVEILGKISPGDEDTVKALIDFLKNSNSLLGVTPRVFHQLLKGSNKLQLCSLTVASLKDYIKNSQLSQSMRHIQIYEVIWLCAEQMRYEDFYCAWHST
ncbi:MAG: NACHT domain-containing protein [Symploca sp. SIO3C6]|nr:NACHT domain-containing protein [Symploca sp. SIO3C6]